MLQRAQAQAKAQPHAQQVQQAQAQAASAEPAHKRSRTEFALHPAVAAVQEIESQLHRQGGVGKVWIDNWPERFGKLGTCRAFLESRSERFVIIPGTGKSYTVALKASL